MATTRATKSQVERMKTMEEDLAEMKTELKTMNNRMVKVVV